MVLTSFFIGVSGPGAKYLRPSAITPGAGRKRECPDADVKGTCFLCWEHSDHDLESCKIYGADPVGGGHANMINGHTPGTGRANKTVHCEWFEKTFAVGIARDTAKATAMRRRNAALEGVRQRAKRQATNGS